MNRNFCICAGSLVTMGASIAIGALIATPAGVASGAALALEVIRAGAGIAGNLIASEIDKRITRSPQAENVLRSEDLVAAVGESMELFFTMRLKEKFPDEAAKLDSLGPAAMRVWKRIAAAELTGFAAASEPHLPLLLVAAREGDAIFSEEAWRELADAIIDEAGLGYLSYRDSIRDYVVRELPRWFVHDFKQVLEHDEVKMRAFQLSATEEILGGQKTTLAVLRQIQGEAEQGQHVLLHAVGVTRKELKCHLAGLDSGILLLERSISDMKPQLDRMESGIGDIKGKLGLILAILPDVTARNEKLSLELGIAKGAIGACLVQLKGDEVSFEKWPEKLTEFATRYKVLEERLARLGLFSREAGEVLRLARAALTEGRLVEAERLLIGVQQKVDESRLLLREELNRQDRDAADIRATRAEAALLRWAYREAANLFGEAFKLMSEHDPTAARTYRQRAADALHNQGVDKGDNEALEEEIALLNSILKEYPRERVPLDWAMTQNNLGNALATLGGRESGTARLEEAVAAYRAALEVFTQPGLEYYRGIAQGNVDRAQALIRERRGGDGSG